jgi:hypothetical protein
MHYALELTPLKIVAIRTVIRYSYRRLFCRQIIFGEAEYLQG